MNVNDIVSEIRKLRRLDAETASTLAHCLACEFSVKKHNIAPSVAEHIQQSLDYAALLLLDECAPPSLEQLSEAAKEKREDEQLDEVLGK